MADSISSSAPPVLHEYYRILVDGSDDYGGGERLRTLLTAHLDFSGPLAGRRPDSTDGFLHGVAGFIATVQRIDFMHDMHDERGSAVLYDATMPAGIVRFAEFFTYRDGLIDTLDLLYDGQDYLAKGGR